MTTTYQCSIKVKKKKKKLSRSRALTFKKKKSPQLRGVVIKATIVTPKKPNSARRPCVKLRLSNKKKPIVHIPGIGHNLRKYSDVLVSGIGPKDLPGVRHSCVRGNRGLDCVWNKKRRRSIYGVKRPDNLKTIIRRKFRKLLGK